jgi:hypothetical protein
MLQIVEPPWVAGAKRRNRYSEEVLFLVALLQILRALWHAQDPVRLIFIRCHGIASLLKANAELALKRLLRRGYRGWPCRDRAQ